MTTPRILTLAAAMTVGIQIFVSPVDWPKPALWATAQVLLIPHGASPLSMDRLFGTRP